MVLALAVLGCGGGARAESSSSTTANTAPPTTLISFTDWLVAVDATAATHYPGIDQYIATAPEPTSLEEAVAICDADRPEPGVHHRPRGHRGAGGHPGQTCAGAYHLFTTTRPRSSHRGRHRAVPPADFHGGELRLAEYFHHFAEAEDLLNDFDVPSCGAPA